jgi:DNA-binding NarL/FixJ family response regulator
MIPIEEVLTSREKQILQLLADGNSLKEIAVAQRLATQTVKFYAQNIREKLNATTTVQAVVIAFRKEAIR